MAMVTPKKSSPSSNIYDAFSPQPKAQAGFYSPAASSSPARLASNPHPVVATSTTTLAPQYVPSPSKSVSQSRREAQTTDYIGTFWNHLLGSFVSWLAFKKPLSSPVTSDAVISAAITFFKDVYGKAPEQGSGAGAAAVGGGNASRAEIAESVEGLLRDLAVGLVVTVGANGKGESDDEIVKEVLKMLYDKKNGK